MTFNPVNLFNTQEFSSCIRAVKDTALHICKFAVMALYFVAVFLVFRFDFVNANVEDHARFDCYPERLKKVALNQTLCEARGCTWKQPLSDQVSRGCCTE